jgi:hypothetical protein
MSSRPHEARKRPVRAVSFLLKTQPIHAITLKSNVMLNNIPFGIAIMNGHAIIKLRCTLGQRQLESLRTVYPTLIYKPLLKFVLIQGILKKEEVDRFKTHLRLQIARTKYLKQQELVMQLQKDVAIMDIEISKEITTDSLHL